MCLGIPGRIIEIYQQSGLAMGKIDFDGIVKEACLAYVPEAAVGDYALVHVGFAINLIDEDEARRTFEVLKEISTIEEELGPPYA